jgi:exopolysaccharide production protein ExoY
MTTKPATSVATASGLRFGTPCKVLVVGAVADVPRALEHPAVGSRTRFDVIGIVPIEADDIVIPAEAIAHLMATQAADTIMVAGPITNAAMDALGELAITIGSRLLVVMPTPVPLLHAPAIVWEGEHPLIQLGMKGDRSLPSFVKRAFDVALAAAILIITAPIVACAAAAVKYTSDGNAFFGHERVGRGGKRFRCWKLRTMAADAEHRLLSDPALHREYVDNSYKLPDCTDPRVTKLGRLLRRTSLDELPQLWNVLVGDMSLVGPRPLIADELKHYSGHVTTLLSVRPGVTGAWAVNGRHRLKYPYRAEVELDYVRNFTLLNDLFILLRTANALIDAGTDPAPRTAAGAN